MGKAPSNDLTYFLGRYEAFVAGVLTVIVVWFLEFAVRVGLGHPTDTIDIRLKQVVVTIASDTALPRPGPVVIWR